MDVTGFHQLVHRRRDVRGEFTRAPVPTEVLYRILGAAHAAPSVGLSQPGDFVLVRDGDTRTAFRDHVRQKREVFASQLDEQQTGTVNLLQLSGGTGMVGSGGSVCEARVRPPWPCR